MTHLQLHKLLETGQIIPIRKEQNCCFSKDLSIVGFHTISYLNVPLDNCGCVLGDGYMWRVYMYSIRNVIT